MDKPPIHDQYARLPWLIVVMTAAFLTIGFVADRNLEHQLVAAKGESLALAAGEIAHKLDLLLAERANDIHVLSRAPVFRGNDTAAKNALLDSFKQIYPLYLLIGVTDAKGRVVAATDRAAIGSDMSDSASFTAARNANTIRIGDAQPSEDAGGLDAVSFTMPITGPDDTFRGVITSRVGLPLLEDVVAQTLRAFQEREDFSGNLHYRFATLGGSVFVDSETAYKGNVNLNRFELPSARLSREGGPGYVEEDHPHLKNRIITGYALTGAPGGVPDLKWTILLYTDKSELVAPIRTLLLKLTAAWIVVWVPMLVFSLWSARRLRVEWTRAEETQADADAAESKYRQLVEQASDIIYRVDLNGYFTYINPSITRFKGYTPEELIGQHFTDHIRPDAREAAKRFYMRQFARRTPSTYYEYPVRKKDGGEIWLGQNVELLSENGRPVGFQAVARDITERKRAEEALRESEERYRELVDLSPSGIFVYCEGKTVYVNRAACRILGADSPDEILGKPTFHFVHPDCHAAVLENARTLLTGGGSVRRAERKYLRMDRTVIDVQVEAAPVIWNGKPAIQGMFSDISDRKRAEEALRTTSEFLQALVQTTPLAIINLDPRSNVVSWNRGAEEMLGWSESEVLGKPLPYIPPDKQAEADRVWNEALEGSGLNGVEIRRFRKDGTPIDLVVWSRTFRDAQGRPTAAVGILADITERKRAEEDLKESEKRFRAIFDQAPLGIAVIDSASGRFIRINDKYCDIVGYSQKDMLDHTFQDITHPDDLPADMENMKQLLEGRIQTFKMEKRYNRKDGSVVWVHLTCVPLWREYETKHRYHLAMVEDITDRKQAEREIEQARSFLNSIVENIPDMVFVKDAKDLRFVQFNKAGEELLGHPRQELIGKNDYDFFPQEEADFFTAKDREVLESRRLLDVPEEPIETRCRGTRILHTKKIPILDNDGSPRYLLGISEDITDRKRAEEALVESERRLALVLEAANEGIWDWNIKTGEVYYSPRWIELLGYEPKDVPPHISFWESIIHPEDLPRVKHQLQAHFEGQLQAYQCENRLRTKAGTWRWNLDRGKVIERDADGRPVRMVGTDTDITERKLAEHRLEKINACFLDFVVSPEANINRLTGLCGELLGAACALYNYLDGTLLRSIGQWNTPPGYAPVSPAVGHVCYDVIRQDASQPMTVRNLPHTPYARTDPNVVPYELQTYVGLPVRRQGVAVGSLCAVFQRDYVPSEADARLLGIITAAIGVEEERRYALTEQKRLLSELAESRNRFEMFFRQTPSAISITTIKEGRFLDLNQQAELLTGYSREELIGRTTVEMDLYVDPSDRPGLVEALKTKGILTDLEREIRTKSGAIRTAVFSLVPIQMGTEPCLLSIAHDITERKQAERRLREQSRQQAIEAELSVLAVTIQDLPDLLSTAAGLVLNALEVNYCEALELIPNGTDLRLCASAGWRGDEIGQVRTLEAGSPAHAALTANKPVIRTLPKESRFGGPQWLHAHGVVTGMSVSIPGKDGPWGVLGVYTTAPRPFSRDDVNFLQTVSSILGAAIERMQTESVLRNANQSLRLLSRQLLQVQEDDRRAIARDLHDEIGQSLTAIKLNVERAQRTADRDARARIMRDCAQITDRVLGQVRSLSLDLHPSILDDLGLPFALKWYADLQAERAGLKVELTADPSLPRLPPDVEVACYRIAQEALTNVVRHARANLAGIVLKQDSVRVELSITDDGVGFAVGGPQADGRTSVGLASMQERAKLLGGTVKITSAPRCGTTVVATLPLPVTSQSGTPAEQAMQP